MWFGRIKDSFSALHHALPTPFSFPQTLDSVSTPLSPQISLYLAHISQARLFDLPAFSIWNVCAVWCEGRYMSTRAWPPQWAALKSAFQSFPVPGAILARLQRMTQCWGRWGVLHGGCVQRPGLLSQIRSALKCTPQPRHTSSLFGASWEN